MAVSLTTPESMPAASIPAPAAAGSTAPAPASVFHISQSLFRQSCRVDWCQRVACLPPIYPNQMTACTRGYTGQDYFLLTTFTVPAWFNRDWLPMHVKNLASQANSCQKPGNCPKLNHAPMKILIPQGGCAWRKRRHGPKGS